MSFDFNDIIQNDIITNDTTNIEVHYNYIISQIQHKLEEYHNVYITSIDKQYNAGKLIINLKNTDKQNIRFTFYQNPGNIYVNLYILTSELTLCLDILYHILISWTYYKINMINISKDEYIFEYTNNIYFCDMCIFNLPLICKYTDHIKINSKNIFYNLSSNKEYSLPEQYTALTKLLHNTEDENNILIPLVNTKHKLKFIEDLEIFEPYIKDYSIHVKTLFERYQHTVDDYSNSIIPINQDDIDNIFNIIRNNKSKKFFNKATRYDKLKIITILIFLTGFLPIDIHEIYLKDKLFDNYFNNTDMYILFCKYKHIIKYLYKQFLNDIIEGNIKIQA